MKPKSKPEETSPEAFEKTSADLERIRERLARTRERAAAFNTQAQEAAVQTQQESDLREQTRERFLKSKAKENEQDPNAPPEGKTK